MIRSIWRESQDLGDERRDRTRHLVAMAIIWFCRQFSIWSESALRLMDFKLRL